MTTFYVAVCGKCECVLDAGRYCDSPELPRVVAQRHPRLKADSDAVADFANGDHGEHTLIATYEAEYAGESNFPNWRPTYADLFGDDADEVPA